MIKTTSIGIVIALASLPACGRPRTAAEACRTQAAMAQFSRAMQQRQNATADALEAMRCDAVARDERDAVAYQTPAPTPRSAPRDVESVMNGHVVTYQYQPPPPPRALGLGARLADVREACEQRHGHLGDGIDHNDSKAYLCAMGQRAIFSCTIDASGAVVRLSAFP